MGSQDQGKDVKEPAEGKAPETPRDEKPPRALRVAELRAAAERARAEGEVPQQPEPTETPTQSPKDLEKAEGKPEGPGAGEKAPVEGKEAPAEGKTAAEQKPEATDGKPAQEGKEGQAELDPKAGHDNPFWKTQLGRYIRETEAATTAEIARLNATIKLLQTGEPKEPPAEQGTSDDIDPELAAELGLADPEKKPAKPEDQATAQAKYTEQYLSLNASEEFRKDPMFGEIQALMFNRNDPANTFNKAWTGNPEADYRVNAANAKAHILEKQVGNTSPGTKPGEGNLKGEKPTAPLGVGGDVKSGAEAAQKKPVVLDEAGQKYVLFMKRKGRDPEKTIAKAFAVNLGGAGGART